MRVVQAKRPGRLEGERRSDGAGGGRLDGRQPDPGGSGRRGDLVSPTRRPGGLSRRRWRVLAVPVARGLPGVGPTPAPAGATVLVYRTTGAAPWGGPRTVRPATSFGRYGARAGHCPTPGWGLDGRPQAGGGASRPAGRSRIRLRPAYRNSRLGPPVRLAARTHNRAALTAAGRGRRVHPAMPGDRGGPAHPGRQLCPLQPHRGCSSLTGLPRTRAPATHPRAHQPGRAGLAWPRRYPPAPSPGPAAPGREQPHPRELQRQTAATGYTDREILYTPREAQVLIEGWRQTSNQLRPHNPSGTAHPHPKPPHPHPRGPQPPNQPQPQTTPTPHHQHQGQATTAQLSPLS